MARHTTLTSLFNDIADSIRYVFGESESVKYTADDFDLTIREIPVAKLEETFDVTPTTSQQTILPSGDEYVFSGGIVRAIPTGTIVENEGSISGSTYTQGNVSVNPAGYISTGEKVSGATFANTATASTTYKDISATTAAPVLISNDYLYINKGYTDNVKISLAKLAPDEGSAELASGHILQGYAAYNNDAQLIAGSIPSLTQSAITPNIQAQTLSTQQKYLTNNITINPLYEEINTAAAMDATLVEENSGKMYKYTGTTTSTYTNGRLYIVEQEA